MRIRFNNFLGEGYGIRGVKRLQFSVPKEEKEDVKQDMFGVANDLGISIDINETPGTKLTVLLVKASGDQEKIDEFEELFK